MAKGKMNWLDWTAIVLILVGAFNWGLVGAFNFNLVTWIFGAGNWIARAVYDLVGISALYSIYSLWIKK